MASKTRSPAAVRMSARLRAEIDRRQREDAEIEVVDEEVPPRGPSRAANTQIPTDGGDKQLRKKGQRARPVTRPAARETAPPPPSVPTPQESPSPNGDWLLRTMQDVGIPVEELLEQRRLLEEVRQMREQLAAQQQLPPAPVAPPAVHTLPQGAFPFPFMMHPDASVFKQQPDFTGHDQDLEAYLRKFKARMEAMRLPLSEYSRMFMGQLDKAALSFATANNLGADTPFEDLIAVMRTGPWLREMTDISGRRRLTTGSLKRKPVHEIVKAVEEIFSKFPSQSHSADKIFFLLSNLPDSLQDKVELSPSGTAWPDYTAFRSYVLQVGALVKPINQAARTPETDKRKPAHSPIPGVGPLRFLNKSPRNAPFSGYNTNANHKHAFKRHKNASSPFSKNDAGSSGWRRVGMPPKKCVACGQTGHQARDTRDGKTPVCRKYDPKKGALIKVVSKNATPQR